VTGQDVPPYLTHYDVPEGHAYADISPTTLEPGDIDPQGNTYVYMRSSGKTLESEDEDHVRAVQS
jgi:hypothetical protein